MLIHSDHVTTRDTASGLSAIRYLSVANPRTPTDLNVAALYTAQRICIIKAVMFVCLFVCLYLCSVWPAKRLGRSTPNLTHALTSTQGVFLARSMSRSFMYARGSDSITKHPERFAKATPGESCTNYVRTTAEATPSERNYSATNEARRRRRRAASAAGASRTPSGGRVITASTL